jgi:hypothetical protein
MMTAFSKCLRCGLFADKRTSRTCGYVAPMDPTTLTVPKPQAPAPPSASKPSLAKRVVAVLLVVPIALCFVTVVKSQYFGLGWASSILIGSVGFGLLGLANHLWAGNTNDDLKG